MKLFGSAVRTKVLILVALFGETYAREIARTGDIPVISVQRIMNDLERDGIVASRIFGGTRRVTLNRRLYGKDELEAFLVKYAKRDPALEAAVSKIRRRPRRAGKAV